MITGRDDEFRGTITFYFQKRLGHDPNSEQMDAYLNWCRAGATGEQIDANLAREPEAIAYASRPKAVALPRIVVDGLSFRNELGTPWRMVFADSFRAYERFLSNPDSIKPVFAELQELGANGIRVLGSFDFGTPDQQRLYPGEHPNYYDQLVPFFNLASQYNLYVQFCVFADTQRSVPGAGNQLAHWNRVCDVLRPVSNLLLQRVNENNQHENNVDADLPKPIGILSSYGSNGTGDDPPQPFWDYCDLGSERRGDFGLSTTTVHYAVGGFSGEGNNPGFPGTKRATVVSEPPGFGEAKTDSRTNDPRIASLLGIGTQWGAGGTAHSDCGVQSVLLTPTQRQCVAEFIRGAK